MFILSEHIVPAFVFVGFFVFFPDVLQTYCKQVADATNTNVIGTIDRYWMLFFCGYPIFFGPILILIQIFVSRANWGDQYISSVELKYTVITHMQA